VVQLGEDAPASLQAMFESHPQSLRVDFQLEQIGGFTRYKDAPTSAYAQLLPFGGADAPKLPRWLMSLTLFCCPKRIQQ
jgi:hypothetical protein